MFKTIATAAAILMTPVMVQPVNAEAAPTAAFIGTIVGPEESEGLGILMSTEFFCGYYIEMANPQIGTLIAIAKSDPVELVNAMTDDAHSAYMIGKHQQNHLAPVGAMVESGTDRATAKSIYCKTIAIMDDQWEIK